MPFRNPDERRAYERDRERRRVRPTADQRGYGAKHRRERDLWRRAVEAGRVLCARCSLLIRPGEAWDLGHSDYDRNVYTGPEHRRCNRSTAALNRRRSENW